jgi:PAP2 superfamily
MYLNGHLQQARRAAMERWSKSTPYDRTIFGVVLAFTVLGGTFLVWRRNIVPPDTFFMLALAVSILLGRAKTFIWDWLPLVALLLGYEYVRSLVPLVNDHIYLKPMIGFDRFVFGSVPTIALQSRFYHADTPRWYDYTAASLYFMHFIVPLGTAFLLWLQDRKMFKEYAAGILILSYAAYLTYLAFPAAPPWLAAQSGLLPPVNRILGNTLMQLSDPISLPTVYSKVGVNMVAAVPSLHAAYPLLTALFVGEKLPKLAPLLAVYVFSVWMAVIYLGEHYAFDVFAGAIYAAATYALVVYWPVVRQVLGRRSKAAVQVS